MGPAFAIENVARFSGAFAFTPAWLVAAAAEVGANLIAADNLLFGRNDTFFAGRLRELRQQAGLTQQQLADNAKMTRDGIAQIETGKNSPSWETVVVLCQALGVDCTEFTKEPTDKKKPGPGRPPKADEAAEKPTARGKRKGKGA
jgi:DNA-binding XRE family transcriptional regulator